MTETNEFVELYITENTLDEILAAMGNPRPITPDKRPDIIERLRELYLAVHLEHRLEQFLGQLRFCNSSWHTASSAS